MGKFMLSVLFGAFLAIQSAGALAQDTADDQLLAEIHQDAAKVYSMLLKYHEQQNSGLDWNDKFLARVKHVAKPVIEEIGRRYPETQAWQWEIHVIESGDEDQALCLAGGKLLVSREYVEDRNSFTDAQLAVLLAHEMAHAVLEHGKVMLTNIKALRPDLANKPAKELFALADKDHKLQVALKQLNWEQEFEADHFSIELVTATGANKFEALKFYHLLAKTSSTPRGGTVSHPPPAARLKRVVAQI